MTSIFCFSFTMFVIINSYLISYFNPVAQQFSRFPFVGFLSHLSRSFRRSYCSYFYKTFLESICSSASDFCFESKYGLNYFNCLIFMTAFTFQRSTLFGKLFEISILCVTVIILNPIANYFFYRSVWMHHKTHHKNMQKLLFQLFWFWAVWGIDVFFLKSVYGKSTSITWPISISSDARYC